MFGFTGQREWVYPEAVKGKWQQVRRVVAVLLHVVLFLGPWLSWGGAPLARFDLAARRVYLFGSVFTASDGVLLQLVLLLAAFSLFFFTSLFGRLWCGYACPHSVFLLNWILPLERLIEGERSIRKLRDGKGWSFDRAWRKAAKWTVFGLVAVALSMAFMGFFEDPWVLWTGAGSAPEYGVVAFFSGLWFWDFAWFREQLCNYLCPYARFQSALADEQSVLVGYDALRGDPRGGKAAKKDGRCIDCNKCVTVCPQGIDIRDGFQLECISCGRCADACEGIMDKLGHESLVTYTSLAALRGGETKWLRPRTVGYAALLTALLTILVARLAWQAPMELVVQRAPGSMFVVDGDGEIRNTFLVKVTNKSLTAATFTVTVEDLPGSEVTVGSVSLAPSESTQVPMIVRMHGDEAKKRTLPFNVTVRRDDGATTSAKTTFKTDASVQEDS